MLKFLKKTFLILFSIFFVLLSLIVLFGICELSKTGRLQSEVIPRLKYTLIDINLLFSTNDYQKNRRYVLWHTRGYVEQLDRLIQLEDGYIVSESDFESEDASSLFSDWNMIYNSKDYRNLFYLLIYGNLSATQKQAIVDFYKTKDKASYYIAKEICKINNPQSMEEFAEIKAYIDEINYDVGFPEWHLMSESEQKLYRESRGDTFFKSRIKANDFH